MGRLGLWLTEEFKLIFDCWQTHEGTLHRMFVYLIFGLSLLERRDSSIVTGYFALLEGSIGTILEVTAAMVMMP